MGECTPQHREGAGEASENRENQTPVAPTSRREGNYNPRDNKEALFQLSVNLPPLLACPPENTFKGHSLVGDDVLLHLKKKEGKRKKKKEKKKTNTQRNAVSFAVS